MNLSLVSHAIPVNDMLEVHFTGGGAAFLRGEDVKAFRRRSGLDGPSRTTAMMVGFWGVIIAAVLLVYFAVRSHG